jgi:hypothetical protein
MTQLGADVDALEELRRSFTREAQRLESSVSNIDAAVRQVWWRGGDGTGFRASWQSTHAPNLHSAVATLTEQAGIVARNRSEQVSASGGATGATGGSGPTVVGPGTSGGSGAGGESDSVPAKDATAAGTVGQKDVYKNEYEGSRQTKHEATYGKGDPLDESTNGLQKPDVRVNLGEKSGETKVGLSGKANGGVTSEYATASGSAEYNLGASADGKVNASIGSDGLKVGAEGRAFAGAEAKAEGSFQSGPVSGTATAGAMVGAEAKGNADVTIGPNGVKAAAGGSAFVGGKAEASGNLDVAGVNVGASGSVSYGLGIEASADAEFSVDRVGVQLDLGATLGIGAEVGIDLSVNPAEVVDNQRRPYST